MDSIDLPNQKGDNSTSSLGVERNALEPVKVSVEMNRVKSVCNIPRIFHKLLRNSDITDNFRCEIKFPYRKWQKGVEVSADSQETLECVINQINSLISASRPKMRPSHFVCLPVKDDACKQAYLAFKEKVLERNGDGSKYVGIDENLFGYDHKLHFTLATLLLVDAEEVRLASRLLTDFVESEDVEGLSRSPLRISVRGLKSMQNDPKRTHVLYACVKPGEDSERLQAIANRATALFARNGLQSGRAGESEVKLHMTLMKSRVQIEAQDKSVGRGKGRIRRNPFPADDLLTDFGDYSFVEGALLDEICLCRMNSTGPDGFYVTEARVKLK
ncbi:unnamed protein product [Mesocestoides corti]|uniref:AKAP7_NLS domain-containing protein n=1 Tax=Mesocestoides corti TaxID=53468 RepID=A0A0R3U503_MESCO|nr:unnamed protein product [Mesocestoides corti]